MFVRNPDIFTYRGVGDLKKDIKAKGLDIEVCDDASDKIDLFKNSIEVEGVEIPNRFCVQPMEGCDGESDGSPGPLTFRKYIRFAKGGTGMIWLEATAVTPEGRANPRQLMITPDNKHLFKKLADDIRTNAFDENGNKIKPYLILQLTHSGRYSKPTGKAEPMIMHHTPVLDSTHNLKPDYPIVTDEYLDELQGKFVQAAQLAYECGYDAIDVKCCHGYLLHEMLSAHTRQNSKYGGSYENRTRFLTDVIGKIKKANPKITVTSRISVYDAYAYPYGWGVSTDGTKIPDLTEPKMLFKRLEELGVTMLNIAMGNPYFNPYIERPYDYASQGIALADEHPLVTIERNIKLTAEMAHAFSEMTMVSIGFTWLRELFPNVCAPMLEKNECHIIGLGRLALADPQYANELFRTGKIPFDKTCITCSSCTQIMRDGGKAGCVIRDSEVYRPIYRMGRLGNEQYVRSIADDCRSCWGAPCKGECPAGVDASAFIKAFYEADIRKSYNIMIENNVIPEACAYTCPADTLCESKCTARLLETDPVPVQMIQRFVTTEARRQGWTKVVAGKPNGKKAVVIGFGPAGMACAIELIKNGFAVTVFEASDIKAGGTAEAVIPEVRLKNGIFEAELNAFELEKTGLFNIKYSTKLDKNFTIDDVKKQGFDAVFIGAGMCENSGMPISQKPQGVYGALEFLYKVKRDQFSLDGVTTAAVIGGGNTAMDAAYSLKKYGVQNVYLIYRRSYMELPAWPDETQKAMQAGVHFLILNQPIDYKAGTDGKISSIKLSRTILGAPDASGRCAPVVLENSEYDFPVDICVEAVGQKVPAELVDVLQGIDFKNGKIVVNDNFETTKSGVYAGGDIINGGKTVVQAVADGRDAAREIIKKLGCLAKSTI